VKGFALAGPVILAVVPSAVWAQAAGAEFRVNTFTTFLQVAPAVSADANGDFVVVWSDFTQDGSVFGIFGQRYDSSGVPRGSEFQINTYTTDSQYLPSVASDPNGNFVVVWTSYGQGAGTDYQLGYGYAIVGRRFNSAGVAQGGEFLASYVTFAQNAARVATDAAGNFVVVWQSYAQDGNGYYGVFGRRFDAAGAPRGGEFQVNTYTTSYQDAPALAVDPSGNFVVVWQSYGQDGDTFGVIGQRFDASGARRGGEFQVNTYTTGSQALPAVSTDANGNFIVVWSSFGQDGDGLGVFGQRFSAAGVRQGGEFRINAYTTGQQNAAAIAADENGNFTVVWGSSVQEGSDYGVFGQRFDAAGVRQGSEFRVNSYTTGVQAIPMIASDPDGDFVVVWPGGNDQDGSLYGVFGQRYGDLIFQDGFDAGAFSRWSSSATDGGDLSVSGAAAMAGSAAGLQALVDDTNPIYVQDDRPSAENRYRARFYFDPNGFDPGEASFHFRTRIFIGFDASGVRLVTLVLKRQAGVYSVEGRARRNDGTRADTGFFTITDGPHFLELDWRRATAPGASDGSLELWIDNGSVATLTGIDNDASPVDFVRMGAIAVKTGAAGTLYYDQFESRRQFLIGPE
jgi:hypothetical protein